MKTYTSQSEWTKDVIEKKIDSCILLENKDGTYSALEGKESNEFLGGMLLIGAADEQAKLEELQKELETLPDTATNSRKSLERKIKKLEKSIKYCVKATEKIA